jgi:hypothetical protein
MRAFVEGEDKKGRGKDYFLNARIKIAALCPILSDSFIHCIGIWTMVSTACKVGCRIPSTSFPKITATLEEEG